MARRNGSPGRWLMTDDYTGVTYYSDQLRKDFWGSYARKPLLRNLQEIASPLNDPRPVFPYRGPNYEYTPPCISETAPQYVGNTRVPTSQLNSAFQVLNLDPTIPNMSIGCTFIVGSNQYLIEEDGEFIVTEDGGRIII